MNFVFVYNESTVVVRDHYSYHYPNKDHKHTDDILREYDKQDERSCQSIVHELHEIHIILMLVRNVAYTKTKINLSSIIKNSFT